MLPPIHASPPTRARLECSNILVALYLPYFAYLDLSHSNGASCCKGSPSQSRGARLLLVSVCVLGLRRARHRTTSNDPESEPNMSNARRPKYSQKTPFLQNPWISTFYPQNHKINEFLLKSTLASENTPGPGQCPPGTPIPPKSHPSRASRVLPRNYRGTSKEGASLEVFFSILSRDFLL